MPNDSDAIDQIFWDALQVPSDDERRVFLHQSCGSNTKLRQRVEKLLKAKPKAEPFLEQPFTVTTLTTNQLGSELGPYRLLHQLGRGGMGVVYEAEQITLGRRVALKILPFAALLNETQLERFAAEATAAARLQHSNIVQVYSVGCERGIHFLAMQLIDGPNLAQVIAELRREQSAESNAAAEYQSENTDTVVIPIADRFTHDADGGGHYRAAARIGREAAEALHYAHKNGVLHRDIKPSNLLLDKSGHAWITDFGLARVEDESQLTRTGDILGTLRYMSPEAATGERVDAQSDVYSLGATLYELATLQPAFDSEDRLDTIKQVIAGNPIAPHRVDIRIPQPLSLIIAKAMARLDERYQSAQELADDLRRFLDGEAVNARPLTPLRRARTWSRRHRLASSAIVGLVILVLLLPFTTHLFFKRVPDDSKSKRDVASPSIPSTVAGAVVAKSPSADANTEADGGINRPNPQDRYQQVFSASDFQSLAAGRYAITQFAYRPNSEITTALQGTYESITVKLSTTSKAPGSLSMTFAENIGPDETIVLSAANFVVSTWNTGPVGGPKGFDMIHNFDTPFEYDPSQGNLLMDISFVWGEGDFSVDGVRNAGADTQLIGNLSLGETANYSVGGVITRFMFERVPDAHNPITTAAD